jgi:hypothetical protein
MIVNFPVLARESLAKAFTDGFANAPELASNGAAGGAKIIER